MAIKFVKSLSGEGFTTIEMRPTKANTAIFADSALTLTGGALTPTAAKPAFIAAADIPSAPQTMLAPVYPVLPQQVFETTFSADAALVKVGDRVTLTADGTQATATTASGVATVWQMFGTAAGDKVHVRFE